MRILNKELAVYLVEFNYVISGTGVLDMNVYFYKNQSNRYVVWIAKNSHRGNLVFQDDLNIDIYKQAENFFKQCKIRGISTVTAIRYSPTEEPARPSHVLKFRLDYSKNK